MVTKDVVYCFSKNHLEKQYLTPQVFSQYWHKNLLVLAYLIVCGFITCMFKKVIWKTAECMWICILYFQSNLWNLEFF